MSSAGPVRTAGSAPLGGNGPWSEAPSWLQLTQAWSSGFVRPSDDPLAPGRDIAACLCLHSSEAAPDVPQRGEGGVQHHYLPALPRALLPRHLPLGEGQLHQELPLHPLGGLLRPGAGGGHAPGGRRLPLHGHRGRLQGGGHLLPGGEPGAPPGRQSGAPAGGGGGYPVATLTRGKR